MVTILGGMIIFLLCVVGGLWATVCVQREQIAECAATISEHKTTIDNLKADTQPRAVQFVVDAACFSCADDRATEPGDLPILDLAAMGDDRPTLA